MRLISFVCEGHPSFGVVVGGEGDLVADLGGRWSSLREAISTASISDLRAAAEIAPTIPWSEVELSVPIPDAERFICAGLNFKDHAIESGRADAPSNPSVFLRSRSTFVAHEQPLLKPNWSESYDYECELAVVIGRGGRHIAQDQAMKHVFGYTLLMDGSVRDVQFDHSLAAGKNFFSSGAIGPWIVTADEIENPEGLQLIGRVNGEQRQSAPISDLIFDIPTLIGYWSRVDALSPGDVLSVGTPSGVGFGFKPPKALKVGDVVETEVPGIGVLRNVVADDLQLV
jgi:2-keto-4-pentenoate hydratase/2-oxohepta-3-ene-1,7-dioic acid hydratase in catechol pathway